MNRVNFQIDPSPAKITPNLAIADPCTAYWFAQVTLRLRREVAWCWYQRAHQANPAFGMLPPIQDAAAENLDLVRYENQKKHFFNTDPTAQYLSEQIVALTLDRSSHSRWRWLVEELNLDEAAEFVMALGLAIRLDAGLAPIFSTCMNDLTRPFPTLALAQRLWDDPLQVVAAAGPGQPIFRYGLLTNNTDPGSSANWQRPLAMPAIVAQQLIDPDAPLPLGVTTLNSDETCCLNKSAEILAARLQVNPRQCMQLVPLLGPKGSAFSDWAVTLGHWLGRQVVAIDNKLTNVPDDLLAFASVCWIRGLDVLLPEQWTQSDITREHIQLLLSTQSIPLRWYIPIYDQSMQHSFPAQLITPPLKIEGLSFAQRVQKFKQGLGGQALELEAAIEECARRFRFQEQMIEQVSRIFGDNRIPLTADSLATACANEAIVELDNLAQLVKPRFGPDELVLPDDQAHQFQEILHAMQTLTVVHYHWGTARVWNESGIAVLFCGSPGTGKTMAAEALATALALPMFRVDLSQVVNKYIGETEKNLKRIFDAAELSDCILFFDEADALFGKRTEVKDAHDRFANIEISYLLERMERFKGLAILATNRRKDLDDAFLRRLRFIIEFPIPGVKERRLIWQLVFPKEVDVSDIDFYYLAKQFQLSGGHIRSIAFNACLRSANAKQPVARGKVLMPDLLIAVKRELEKTNRSASEELFGSYSHMIREQVA